MASAVITYQGGEDRNIHCTFQLSGSFYKLKTESVTYFHSDADLLFTITYVKQIAKNRAMMIKDESEALMEYQGSGRQN